MYTVNFNEFRDFGELDMLITDAMREAGASTIISEQWADDGYEVVFGW